MLFKGGSWQGKTLQPKQARQQFEIFACATFQAILYYFFSNFLSVTMISSNLTMGLLFKWPHFEDLLFKPYQMKWVYTQKCNFCTDMQLCADMYFLCKQVCNYFAQICNFWVSQVCNWPLRRYVKPNLLTSDFL